MSIRMVDLSGQYKNIKEEIDTAIQKIIDSSAFINGKQVGLLAAELSEYLACKHVIPCANGTDALQIALMACNLKEGDEVIIPDFTFIATAEVAALLKFKPVFVDVDPDTFLMDINKFEAAISNKTRAVIPVHLYGQCANMQEIIAVAKENNIYVIEDNAQAIGANITVNGKQVKAGTSGDIACTSFFPSKVLGCFGDGGAIYTNNDELAFEMKAIANHGARKKYYNDIVGVNSRLDTIQAAILSVKLKYLDSYIHARQKAAEYYDKLLANLSYIQIPRRVSYSEHVFHQYTLKVSKRDELKSYLAEKDIPSMIYYPLGMHNQKAYKTSGDFPVSDELCKNVLSLPIHTELIPDQQKYIVDSIIEFYN